MVVYQTELTVLGSSKRCYIPCHQTKNISTKRQLNWKWGMPFKRHRILTPFLSHLYVFFSFFRNVRLIWFATLIPLLQPLTFKLAVWCSYYRNTGFQQHELQQLIYSGVYFLQGEISFFLWFFHETNSQIGMNLVLFTWYQKTWNMERREINMKLHNMRQVFSI